MKNKVPVAIGKKTPKDLSKSHFTSFNFGETIPVYSKPVFPNTTLKVRPDLFARTAPLQLPTLASISMDVNAFYVPYRYIWRFFEDFITKQYSSVNSDLVQFEECLYVPANLFYKVIFGYQDGVLSYDYSPFICVDGEEVDFTLPESNWSDAERNFITADFYEQATNQAPKAYKLTQFGKYILHVVHSLGYNLNFNYDVDIHDDHYHINIMPLLAYFKIFYDYYLPSQLSDSSPYKQLFGYINSSSTSDMSSEAFGQTLLTCFLYSYNYYKSNYFTSAWCSPNSPLFDTDNNDYQIYSNQISDRVNEYNNTSIVINDSNDSAYVDTSELQGSTTTTGTDSIPYESLNFLQKFARLIKRNLLSGKRPSERLKAEFGVNIDDFTYGRCHYYGSDSIVLNKSEVVGTADENLGEYAGKAWMAMAKPKEFTFNCDFYGIVIIMAKLQTPSQFVDGIRHDLLCTSPTDFYTPDLDGSIMQAISGHELLGRLPYNFPDIRTYVGYRHLRMKDVYGFVPRYSHLKQSIDDVSGDFALPRYSGSIDGFILPRRILDVNKLMLKLTSNIRAGNVDLSTNDIIDSEYIEQFSGESNSITPLQVLRATDSKQFNRIFKDIDGVTDPFWCVFQFDVVSYDGSIPLDESHELQGKGKDIYFEKNGVNL